MAIPGSKQPLGFGLAKVSLAEGRLRQGKRWLRYGGFLLASSLSLGFISQWPALADQRWGTVVYVNTPPGYALNSRWGPGTNFGIHSKTRRGCPLELSGVTRQGWLQLINGTWVAGNWVTASPRERIACTSTPTPQQVAIVSTPPGYALNIRTGPGTGYARVGQYVHGTRLPFTRRFSGRWTELTDGNWVDGNYLQFAAGEGPPTSPTPEPPTSDPNVENLQRRLKQLGYLPAEFVINGVYDPQTQAAVRGFQRASGLPVTGVVDEPTWRALYNATEPRPPMEGRQMRVNAHDAGRADVYAGPGPEYERLGTFVNGTLVTTTGRVIGNWTETQGGRWIFTAWLEPI